MVVSQMKWEEVRKIYPDQYVLLSILESYTDGDKKYVDEVAPIRSINSAKEATNELLHAKPSTLVYHTRNDKIVIEIRKRAICKHIFNQENKQTIQEDVKANPKLGKMIRNSQTQNQKGLGMSTKELLGSIALSAFQNR